MVGGASLPWGLPSRHLVLSPMSEADHEVTTWGSRCAGIHAAIAVVVPTAVSAVIQAVAWFSVLISVED